MATFLANFQNSRDLCNYIQNDGDLSTDIFDANNVEVPFLSALTEQCHFIKPEVIHALIERGQNANHIYITQGKGGRPYEKSVLNNVLDVPLNAYMMSQALVRALIENGIDLNRTVNERYPINEPIRDLFHHELEMSGILEMWLPTIRLLLETGISQNATEMLTDTLGTIKSRLKDYFRDLLETGQDKNGLFVLEKFGNLHAEITQKMD